MLGMKVLLMIFNNEEIKKIKSSIQYFDSVIQPREKEIDKNNLYFKASDKDYCKFLQEKNCVYKVCGAEKRL